ncbi:hypothetical protein SNEBB_009083 [Seison nebaliae]|nr:hypothetical protein SNEBB_009083 [Seison nebaliae]
MTKLREHIDRILGKRWNNGSVEYLIRWKNKNKNTWEDEKELRRNGLLEFIERQINEERKQRQKEHELRRKELLKLKISKEEKKKKKKLFKLSSSESLEGETTEKDELILKSSISSESSDLSGNDDEWKPEGSDDEKNVVVGRRRSNRRRSHTSNIFIELNVENKRKKLRKRKLKESAMEELKLLQEEKRIVEGLRPLTIKHECTIPQPTQKNSEKGEMGIVDYRILYTNISYLNQTVLIKERQLIPN